MNAIANLNF